MPDTAADAHATVAVSPERMRTLASMATNPLVQGLGSDIAALFAKEIDPVALLKALGWFQISHPADFKLSDNVGAILAAADTVFPDPAGRAAMVAILTAIQGLAAKLNMAPAPAAPITPSIPDGPGAGSPSPA